MRHGPSAGKPQSGLATGERPRCVSTCALLFCLGLILLSPQCPHAAQTGHPCPLAWPFIEEVTRLPTPRSWGGAWGRGVGSILTLRYVSKDATCDLSWESPWRDIMPGPPFPPHCGLVPAVSLLLSSRFLLSLVWLQFPDSRFVPITKSLSHTIQLPLHSPIGLSRTPRTRQLRSGAVLHNTHPYLHLPSPHTSPADRNEGHEALLQNKHPPL